MIISHKHKFIFFAIPKTGTHSVRFALRPFLDDNDEEHVNLFHQSKLTIPELQDRRDGHISVQEIRPYISSEIWQSYFKFCFVRNPWDRFLSTVLYRNINARTQPALINPLLHRTIDKQQHNTGLFYKPQSDFVIDSNHQLSMNFTGKTESMQADFDQICEHLRIPHTLLAQRNSAKHEQYRFYYDDLLIQKVGKFYNTDIQNFDYSF